MALVASTLGDELFRHLGIQMIRSAKTMHICAISLLALAGCGGGGSDNMGGPPIVVPPPPPPAPPPPPPPPPPSNTTVSDLQFDQIFMTATANIQYPVGQPMKNANVFPVTVAPLFGFRASDRSFTFDGSANFSGPSTTVLPARFLPADAQPQISTSFFTQYMINAQPVIPSNTPQHRLRLYRSPSASDQVPYRFATHGFFEYLSQTGLGDLVLVDHRPFAFGLFTPSTFTSQSIVTYRGVVDGRTVTDTESIVDGVPVLDINGTFEITFDFARRTLRGSVSMQGRDNRGQTIQLPVIQLAESAGTVTFPRVSGTAGSGNFEGFFAGPNGEEYGFAFQTSLPDTRTPRNNTFRIVAAGVAR